MVRYDREIFVSFNPISNPPPQLGRWTMMSGKSWKWSLAVPEYSDCPILWYRPWMGTARNTPYPMVLKALGLKSSRYRAIEPRGADSAISILVDRMSVLCRERLFGLEDRRQKKREPHDIIFNTLSPNVIRGRGTNLTLDFPHFTLSQIADSTPRIPLPPSP